MYTNMVDVFFRALSLVRFSEIWHHNLTEKSAPTIFHISIAEEDDLFSSLVPQAFKRPRLANDFDAANYPCFIPGLEPFLFLQWGFLFFLFYTRGPATNSWLLIWFRGGCCVGGKNWLHAIFFPIATHSRGPIILSGSDFKNGNICAVAVAYPAPISSTLYW